jgi:hypothetical protein
MRRKIADERDARACLRAAERAGVTPTTWAREHGVDARSLHAWRINVVQPRDAKRETVTGPRMVELVPAATAAVRTARYVVRVADAEIELADDFGEETLARLVRTLRAC